MSFVKACVDDSLPIWEKCLDTPFLKEMEAGTLSRDKFFGYIVDDSLYLREYARVFAAGIVKAKNMEEIRTYYSFLAFVNEGEGTTRVDYLKKGGLTDEIIEQLPQRPENRDYTEFMINAVWNGDTGAECLMAGLPCMLSYTWIFRKMVERSPQVLDSFFGPMIRDYVIDASEQICIYWSRFADRLCADLSEQEKTRCMEIFRQSSRYELGFWNMSGSPRADLAGMLKA